MSRSTPGLLLAAAGLLLLATSPVLAQQPARPLSYVIVDTGQRHCFSDTGQLRELPGPGQPFFGQDAFYQGPEFRYRDNQDGTVSDLNTGLMWQKTPDLENQKTFPEAQAGAKKLRLGGHRDWRMPTLKELYSLIDFNGDCHARPPTPYLDTRVFDFRFGDPERDERLIDAQYWSATEYLGRTMRDDATVFGVNFADGRIKGYPRDRGPRGDPNRQFVRYVRGNSDYGENRFVRNQDGTISDLATGLMWSRNDSGEPLNWEQALAWCEKLEQAGHDDWRLPNVKELQSIVDYGRAPDARDPARRGPAIDPVFLITDPEAWFWSSTTHLEGGRIQGSFAAYVAFGRATGTMGRPGRAGRLMNVHGAGAQRSDPKSGNPESPQWARGMGPQGDTIRILNYARAVRDITPGLTRRVAPDTSPVPPSSPPGRDERGPHRDPPRGGRRDRPPGDPPPDRRE